MDRQLAGIPASPGIVLGPVHLLLWEVPEVPQRIIDDDAVDGEIARFHATLERARDRLRHVRARAAGQAGEEEARIFDAQLYILEDQELIGRVEGLIRQNLAAESAFEITMLEWRHHFARHASPMMRERVGDITDVQIRVLSLLLGLPDHDPVELPKGANAVLVTHGQYHAGCRERHHRLERIARAENTGWLREVADYHAVGVEFKLHPERGGATRESLQVSHDEVSLLAQKLWLQLESRRLGCAFATARIYAGSPLEKWPDAGRGKNLLRNLRAFGLRRALRRKTFRQPRERVCHALALLLWEPDVLRQPILLRHVQEELGTPATGFAEMVAAYCRLWERVK